MGNSEIVVLLLMFALACAQYKELSSDGDPRSPPAVDGGYSDPGADYPAAKAPSRNPASTVDPNPKAPLPVPYPPFQEDPSYPYQQQEIYPLIIAANGTDPNEEIYLKNIPMEILYQQHTQDEKADPSHSSKIRVSQKNDKSNPYEHTVPIPNYPYDPTTPSDDKDASEPNTFPRYKEPVYPATPSYPNDESHAITSSYPKHPTEPSKDPYPNKPSNPSKPNDPSYPSGPSFDKGSSDPSNNDPSYPATPSYPSEPSNPSTDYNKQPTGPSTPSYPKNPSNPGTAPGPTNPSYPSKPSYQNNPPYPATPSPPKNPTYTETADTQDARSYLTNPDQSQKDSSYHVVKPPAKLSPCASYPDGKTYGVSDVCFAYFECKKGNDLYRQCDDHYKFDEVSGQCVQDISCLTACPEQWKPHPSDIYKFILGGTEMSCPYGTFFDYKICSCQSKNNLPKDYRR
ncbi:hypothetical protein BsWGS_00856 [Bradybaena similaris]